MFLISLIMRVSSMQTQPVRSWSVRCRTTGRTAVALVLPDVCYFVLHVTFLSRLPCQRESLLIFRLSSVFQFLVVVIIGMLPTIILLIPCYIVVVVILVVVNSSSRRVLYQCVLYYIRSRFAILPVLSPSLLLLSRFYASHMLLFLWMFSSWLCYTTSTAI